MLSKFLRAAAPFAASDPYFKQTTLLLHGDGTNGTQNNTFLDSSTKNLTITRYGNSTQGTFSPHASNWSNYFAASGNFISFSGANNVNLLGNTDFTIEAWICQQTAVSGTYQTIVSHTDLSSARNFGWDLRLEPSSIKFYVGSGTADNEFLNVSYTPTVGKWTHIAIVRSGATAYCYADGVLKGSATFPTTFNLTGKTSCVIGNRGLSSSEPFPGFISNVRIVSGTALYTSNFTPGTAPLTAVSGTTLLTCQSNRFVDNSSNNFAATITGTPSVQRFSPFNPTSDYDASTIGGSAYFDGAGDLLTISSNADLNPSAGAFTFECWFMPTAAWKQTASAGDTLFISEVSSGIQIGRPSSGSARGDSWGLCENLVAWRLTASSQPVIGQWNHLAVSRSGTGTNQTALFLNGIRLVSGTVTTTFAQGTTYIMGGTSTGASASTGYVSDMRFVKGAAMYNPASATYTMPAAPLKASDNANTMMMLNFTNAGIVDSTGKNNLETVGNVQIDTTTKKFGTGSIKFDGTGDWLQAPSSPLFGLGTGDFTIEFWVYFNNLTGAQTIIDFRPGVASSTAVAIYMNTSNMILYVSNADKIVGGTVSATQWYHVALSRSGTSTRLFLNGTQVGSTFTDSTNYNTPAPIRIGNNNDGFANGGLNGAVDDLRITKGIARYTGDFTPPSSPFLNR